MRSVDVYLQKISFRANSYNYVVFKLVKVIIKFPTEKMFIQYGVFRVVLLITNLLHLHQGGVVVYFRILSG